jgi:hypothetical protein
MGREVAILGRPSWDLALPRFDNPLDAAKWALSTCLPEASPERGG